MAPGPMRPFFCRPQQLAAGLNFTGNSSEEGGNDDVGQAKS
ncbi:hypothetical protein [Paenibacillus tyrfis]|nr:hypothetical protein [Paenibacillus tyrfis]